MKTPITLLFAALAALHSIAAFSADPVRLKDLGRLDGWRENYLVGFGMVTGLAGTGDSTRSKATRQSVANLLSNFDVTIPPDQINSRNVAIVSVMAALPAVSRPGDKVDVVVTSLGDAHSLAGGTLLLAPLKASDGKLYALAQGPVSIGGYRYDQNGNIVQKNHPTVGMIPGGAQIEKDILSPPVNEDGSLIFILSAPDHTTSRRVASAINATFKQDIAVVRDSGSVKVQLPVSQRRDPSTFLSTIESVEVVPDKRAIVVINERTGTVVAGGDVRISKVTIAHGDIKVSVTTDYVASQPVVIGYAGPNIRTEVLPSTRIDVNESEAGVVEMGDRSSVGSLVRALNRIKVSTRDVIAILQGIKTAGALHAELVIQ